MQLSDVLYWLYTATGIVSAIIAVAVTFRAFEMRRVLVGAIYWRRASGTAALMIIAIFSILVSPNTGITTAPFFSTPVGSLLTTLPLLLFFVAFYAFVDSNVLAAMEIDFFHRNTLHWRQVRGPFYAVMFLILIGLSLWVYLNPILTFTATNVALVGLVFAGLGVVLTYSALALVLVSRNTPDLTMKRFVRLIGIGPILFVVSSTIWFLDAYVNYLGDAISGLFTIASTLALYKAVMALSSVGKLERQIEAK